MSASRYELPFPIVVSAPSGTGKTTLCQELMKQYPEFAYSISATTRPQRGAEQHGVNYYFVSDAQFDDMIDSDAFLEWAHVHQHRYGTPRSELVRLQEQNQYLLLDIDVQGGMQVKEKIPEALLLFVLPPNMQVLEQRLRDRATDSNDSIEVRLKAAQQEMQYLEKYDFFLINDTLETAVSQMKTIIDAVKTQIPFNREYIQTTLGGLYG